MSAQQLDERRLARARRPDQRHLLAGGNPEIQPLEQGVAIAMAEADAAELDRARRNRQRRRLGRIGDLVRAGDQINRLGQRAVLLEEIEHPVRQVPDVHADQIAEREHQSEAADADARRYRIGHGDIDHDGKHAEHSNTLKQTHDDEEGAQSHRARLFEREIAADVQTFEISASEAADRLGVGDRIDQLAGRRADALGESFGQADAATGERGRDHQIEDRPGKQQ